MPGGAPRSLLLAPGSLPGFSHDFLFKILLIPTVTFSLVEESNLKGRMAPLVSDLLVVLAIWRKKKTLVIAEKQCQLPFIFPIAKKTI